MAMQHGAGMVDRELVFFSSQTQIHRIIHRILFKYIFRQTFTRLYVLQVAADDMIWDTMMDRNFCQARVTSGETRIPERRANNGQTV